ncbi:glycosyltransferase family 4 protein [Frigoribacterium sp. 9N]|uniref:glycosyltransferase family 4 protein n=1 Tax=Frigoribacterium sp. 9N TaxID=2653144 RepID=UPI0012F200C7|nr:glycosyltransferase family 4 protein [Frigoribacterium sp. 9N]VXB26289.1 conserved hypothetical protein [Frigoribacterium sp. 9N]
MKIVYLHQYFKTPKENGGVRSYHFARALTSRGHDVHVVTSDTAPAGRLGTSHEVVDGIDVHRIAVAYDNTMGVSRRVVAFIHFALSSAKLARRLRADVVVATSTPLTIAIPAMWAVAGRRHARFVFEVRDLWPEVPIAMGYLKNPFMVRAARWLERRTYDRADRIIALSHGMADGVARAGGERQKLAVVPNIADIETFQAVDSAQKTVLDDIPALGRRPIALYCGTFGRVNGLHYMVDLAIEAVRQESDIAFVAVGTGVQFDEVIQYARRYGVLNKSFFALPPVPKAALPGLLARATFGSSWVIDVEALEHNSANKFFDTLASGRPMLVNHGGWQADVLHERGAGWELSRNARKAVEQLDGILEDEASIKRAGEAAFKLAIEKYSLEVLSRSFVDIVTNP